MSSPPYWSAYPLYHQISQIVIEDKGSGKLCEVKQKQAFFFSFSTKKVEGSLEKIMTVPILTMLRKSGGAG